METLTVLTTAVEARDLAEGDHVLEAGNIYVVEWAAPAAAHVVNVDDDRDNFAYGLYEKVDKILAFPS